MKYTIQNFMYKATILLEVIVGFVILSVIAVSIFSLIVESFSMTSFDSGMLFNYLENAMSIIIGIEFAKLIFSHTIDAAVEVMLLAIVRTTIIEHPTALNILLHVIAVAILFLTRKYLFIPALDKPHIGKLGLFKAFFSNKNAEGFATKEKEQENKQAKDE